ncbi:polyprenyl synthetase family protein [uncultured Ruthenibacterium sp.]|uniref:polyprenyl synthetase family protein n=1 Tax=uncultured Ruthenibacterium sp. TaxID=1905347 RepID=UPI00349E6F48
MEYEQQYQFYLNQIETRLHEIERDVWNPESQISKAAFYSLLGGGKRIRSILCMAVCDMLGGPLKLACEYASALEMVHCYSLIHDDLPCMDNDDFRRGKPSCHKAFGEAQALLAGDALLTGAFEILACAPCAHAQQNVEAVKILSRAAGCCGMIWGQELDLRFEKEAATEQQLQTIHENKTGKLIDASAQLGAVAACADSSSIAVISDYAFSIGLVFQIVDDILDVTATSEVLGKPAGSDQENGKTTFVTLYGIPRSLEMAKEITEKACSDIRKKFGEKAVFLEKLAYSLLQRNK